ncbi:MAG: right-handed parallel beta-helix repeat-containing protein, partial [Planctomycetes bacterium]|nr:right-handed parallel beta-helix repeat-containing protein [Planctomycetota bacterium]
MFSRSPIPTCLTLLTWALLAAAAAGAQITWHVDDDAPNDPGPGDPTISDPLEDGSAEHPFDAIQEGIYAAEEGDTVLVADGTYTGAGNRNLHYDGKAIEARSENGPDDCVIDCAHATRGFSFDSRETKESRVDGFTITNGNADGGGAICCDGARPTIMNCILVANVSEYGGGAILCYGRSPTIAACVLVGNAAEYGGGISCGGGSSPAVLNCLIAANTASRGGGAFLVGSAAIFANCTIV